MRILEVAALFTMMFIARGGCRPNNPADGSDYLADTDDYEAEENSEGDNRVEQDSGAASPSSSHIQTSPLKLVAKVGDQVILPCDVTNPQEVVVSWTRGLEQLYSDDLPYLPVNERTRIVRQKNNSLIINDFRESDVSDNYICEIVGEPLKKVIHSVHTPKDVYVSPSDKIEVFETNKDVTLACNANWQPKPTISWSRMGKSFASDPSPKDGSLLTIKNVTASDAGLYQCLAETDPGHTNPIVRGINLIVHYAPVIKVENEIVHTGIHMESELTCSVDAYPPAELRWYKDGKIVAGSKQSKSESTDLGATRPMIKHTLVFSRTEKSDFGRYTCEASNSMGQAKRLIDITGAPAEAKFIRLQLEEDTTKPILVWDVVSYSPIKEYKLKYRRVGDKDWRIATPRATDDSTINTFRISHPIEALKAGAYEAVLLAQNDFGWSPEPREPYRFTGGGSKSGASSTQSLNILRSLLIPALLLVYTTYL